MSPSTSKPFLFSTISNDTLFLRFFVLLGADSRLRLWDIETGNNTLVNYRTTRGKANRGTQIAVSPDGSHVYQPSGSAIQVRITSALLKCRLVPLSQNLARKAFVCAFAAAYDPKNTGSIRLSSALVNASCSIVVPSWRQSSEPVVGAEGFVPQAGLEIPES